MCQVLHENCEKELANDSSLPTNSYLVTYILENEKSYDIVMCYKKVEVFNMYWDKYRENLLNIDWTKGKINPKLWGIKPSESKKKKR